MSARWSASSTPAARDGVELLVFPDACLGGYIGDLRAPDLGRQATGSGSRRARDRSGDRRRWADDRVRRLCRGGAPAVATTQRSASPVTASSATTARSISLPAKGWPISAGDAFAAFDTPVGRLGMLIDYDKTFPESARALALDGAQLIAALSAWPASVTDRASRLPGDRQSRLFDLYDCARAAENQVVRGLVEPDRCHGHPSVPRPGEGGGPRRRRSGQHRIQGRTGRRSSSTSMPRSTARRRVLNHLAERRVDAYDIAGPRS